MAGGTAGDAAPAAVTPGASSAAADGAADLSARARMSRLGSSKRMESLRREGAGGATAQLSPHGLGGAALGFDSASLTREMQGSADTPLERFVEVQAQQLANRLDGDEHAEKLSLFAGGANLEIFTSAPKKRDAADPDAKYTHLNLRLAKLPEGAHGLLALLAGKQPLSDEAKQFLTPAKRREQAGPTVDMRAWWDHKAQTLRAAEIPVEKYSKRKRNTKQRLPETTSRP